MKRFNTPSQADWTTICERPSHTSENIDAQVMEILSNVKETGDAALRAYTEQFDGIQRERFAVNAAEIQSAAGQLTHTLKAAIQLAADNIERFHTAQIVSKKKVETAKGVHCWRETRAIEKVGLYIPGGTAPLFSTVLMLGIPAKIAGCKDIVLCTPPSKDGTAHPALRYTAQLVGVTEMYAVGGAQAIGAMAYGTESIPRVDKLFGPGNRYVTTAKEQVQQEGIAIDLPAGPSELLVIADETCNPAFVAADLLAQAEHGADSHVLLVSPSNAIIDAVMVELDAQLPALPRKELARQSLKHSCAVRCNSIEECIDLSNRYAPEHLMLASKDASSLVERIQHAGAVFIGNYSCESAGDYASGTNHTLPTNGYARSYSGVSLDSFVRTIAFQQLSKEGLQNIGPAIECMAEAEALFAHKNAVTLRLKNQ